MTHAQLTQGILVLNGVAFIQNDPIPFDTEDRASDFCQCFTVLLGVPSMLMVELLQLVLGRILAELSDGSQAVQIVSMTVGMHISL